MLEDITLYEFNSLADHEKAECLWEYGVHVSERFDKKFGYNLYQISNFYVEANITVIIILYLSSLIMKRQNAYRNMAAMFVALKSND